MDITNIDEYMRQEMRKPPLERNTMPMGRFFCTVCRTKECSMMATCPCAQAKWFNNYIPLAEFAATQGVGVAVEPRRGEVVPNNLNPKPAVDTQQSLFH